MKTIIKLLFVIFFGWIIFLIIKIIKINKSNYKPTEKKNGMVGKIDDFTEQTAIKTSGLAVKALKTVNSLAGDAQK